MKKTSTTQKKYTIHHIYIITRARTRVKKRREEKEQARKEGPPRRGAYLNVKVMAMG